MTLKMNRDAVNPHDYEYLFLLNRIMNHGYDKGDRTGVGTRSVFGAQSKFNLEDGFPLLTTKKMFWKGIVHELLWFISGDTNIKYLKDNGVNIWNQWADEDGDLGPVYGSQWRNWETPSDAPKGNVRHIDQLQNAIQTIKDNPNSRRIIVTAWNPAELENMALPPCHLLYQFNVQGGKLHLQMYQRSCDVFLGVPFNIASYALLLMMVAQVTGLEPGTFTHTYGDVHIYNNHFAQVREQLERAPYKPPSVRLDPSIKHIDDFKFEHIDLVDYFHHDAIKAPIAV